MMVYLQILIYFIFMGGILMSEYRKLYRSTRNRIISGVCGGLAEYFYIDPNLMRFLWIIFMCMGGSGIVAYIICIFVIPEDINI